MQFFQMHSVSVRAFARSTDFASSQVRGRAGGSQPDGGRREGSHGTLQRRHEKGQIPF